jgi:hypothetical protein
MKKFWNLMTWIGVIFIFTGSLTLVLITKIGIKIIFFSEEILDQIIKGSFTTLAIGLAISYISLRKLGYKNELG